MSDITPINTGSPGIVPVPNYNLPVVLGATTLTKGLVNVMVNNMQNVELPKFQSSLNVLGAPVETPTVSTGGFSRTKRDLTQGDLMYYSTFNPIRDFEGEWKFEWAQGKLTEARLASVILSAVQKSGIDQVNNGIEQLIWKGDDASGDAWLNRFNGFEKLIEADSDTDVNFATPAGAITKANVIDILESMWAVTPAAVRENLNVKIIMSHDDKELYNDALRDATITKGINIMDGNVLRFAGKEIVSTGISKDKIVICVANNGSDSNLHAATWMSSDYGAFQIEKYRPESELWFIKMLFKMGVQYRRGSEITYYKPV
jgi:hypothetical protein